MKIFNWVQRRINHREDTMMRNGLMMNTSSTTAADHDQDISSKLSLTSDYNYVLDGWKLGSGILTIGTFGYHPLKNEDENEDIELEIPLAAGAYMATDSLMICNINEDQTVEIKIANHDSHEEADQDAIISTVNEEENPLMHAASNHGYEGFFDHDQEVVMEMDSGNQDRYTAHASTEINKTKDRITLADLFLRANDDDEDDLKSGDHHNKKQQEPFKALFNGRSPSSGKAILVKEKNNATTDDDHDRQYCSKLVGISFPKKKKQMNIGGDQDQGKRSIHKLQRLMKRMLKRKIHPDFGLNKDNSTDSEVMGIN